MDNHWKPKKPTRAQWIVAVIFAVICGLMFFFGSQITKMLAFAVGFLFGFGYEPTVDFLNDFFGWRASKKLEKEQGLPVAAKAVGKFEMPDGSYSGTMLFTEHGIVTMNADKAVYQVSYDEISYFEFDDEEPYIYVYCKDGLTITLATEDGPEVHKELTEKGILTF